jgi:hypothetical protein
MPPVPGLINQLDALQRFEERLQDSGNEYWATQVRVMERQVKAWSAQAENKSDEAVVLLREAAMKRIRSRSFQ